jgi:hypothetical protein
MLINPSNPRGWVGIFIAIALLLAAVCAFVICRTLKRGDERAKRQLDDRIDDLMEEDLQFVVRPLYPYNLLCCTLCTRLSNSINHLHPPNRVTGILRTSSTPS